jgi:hypothetical protein
VRGPGGAVLAADPVTVPVGAASTVDPVDPGTPLSLSLSMLPSLITDPLHPSVLPTTLRVDLVTAALDLAMPRLTPTTTRSNEGGT